MSPSKHRVEEGCEDGAQWPWGCVGSVTVTEGGSSESRLGLQQCPQSKDPKELPREHRESVKTEGQRHEGRSGGPSLPTPPNPCCWCVQEGDPRGNARGVPGGLGPLGRGNGRVCRAVGQMWAGVEGTKRLAGLLVLHPSSATGPAETLRY